MNYGLKYGFVSGKTKPSGYILLAPSNFAGVGSDEGGGVFAATLTWIDTVGNTEATASYLLYKDDVFLASIPAGTLTYVDNDVLPDAGYRYTIRTKDVVGFNSEHTSSLSVAIPNLILASTPAMPTIAMRGIDSFTLNWTAPTEGSYPISEYIVKMDGTEVSRTASLTDVVYFVARKRTYPTWTVTAVDTAGWQSSESPGRTTDSTNGDIDPLSAAIEWTYQGTSSENIRVFIGAILQNQTPINVDSAITYGGIDNQYDGVQLGDVEFSYKSELLSDQCHSFPLAIKMTDSDNFISMRIWGGLTQVYERINGTWTKLFTTPHSGNKNETFMIKSVGQVITCYRNGTLIFTHTTTLTGTRVGIVQRECPSGNFYLGSYYKLVTETCDAEGTQLLDNSTFDCGTLRWSSDATYPATITDNGDGSLHLQADTEYGSLVPDKNQHPDGSYNITVQVSGIVGVGKVSIRDGSGTWHSTTLVDGENIVPYTGVIDNINVGADNDTTFEADFQFLGLEAVVVYVVDDNGTKIVDDQGRYVTT